MDAFFDHMYKVMQKDPKPGNKSLEKCPGPNPNTTEKEGDKALRELKILYICLSELIQKNEKAKQVVPVDFTVLKHIKDPDAFIKKYYELEEPEMYASTSLQKLVSNLKKIPYDDKKKALAMVYDLLGLKQHVIPPLVIPEMPKFSRLDVVRSPWTPLPSRERLREQRGEDTLEAFQELTRNIFGRSPGAYYSDDDTNPLPGVGSVRSLSTSPGYQFSFENEEINTPSHAGPSGCPNVEMEEFPSQEKVHEMTSEARGGNFSDDDDADNEMPDEPETHSPWDNSPVNIEVAVSGMPMENPPVDIEVSPSAVPLQNQPEEEVVIKEASSRKGKKRGLEHADSSLDIHSEIPTPMSDRNPMAQVGAGVVEPPGKRDEQMAPPKKRNKRQPKR